MASVVRLPAISPIRQTSVGGNSNFRLVGEEKEMTPYQQWHAGILIVGGMIAIAILGYIILKNWL